MATVLMNAGAREQYDALPKSVRERVNGVFARLSQWPEVSGAKPLRGDLAGQYRVRTGDYRVQFVAAGKAGAAVVTVVRVGHRDGFYDD